MKICSKCKVSKLEEDFSRHGKWLQAWCRKCDNAYAKVYQQKHRESGRERSRKYYTSNRSTCLEKTRRRRAMNPAKTRAARQRWAAANPEKEQAQWRLKAAVRSGKIIKPSHCELCGKGSPPLDSHHPNYDLPFEVVFCCHPCHMGLHMALRQEAA